MELAEEISRVTTIKELLSNFIGGFTLELDAIIILSEEANPVRTYQALVGVQDFFTQEAETLQAKLLEVLGQVGETDSEAEPAPIVGSIVADALDGNLEADEPLSSHDESLDIATVFDGLPGIPELETKE